MIKKIISILVVIMFSLNSTTYGLGITPGSNAPDTKEGMYALGQKLFAAKRGPGAIDFDLPKPEKFIGEVTEYPGVKFVKADYDNLPEGWTNSPILQKTDLIEALKYFRDKEAQIHFQDLEIQEGYFEVDEESGELPIARIEKINKGTHEQYVLVIHTKFVQMWNHIRENDLWFEYDFPDGATRTVSVAWGLFYRLAKHEMSDLEKDTLFIKNIGHIVSALRSGELLVQDNELVANSTSGRYWLLNDAIWMWFLGSYCFSNSTRYNDMALSERLKWFFCSDEAGDLKLNKEFPNLDKRPVDGDIAMKIARRINYHFFSRPGMEVPQTKVNDELIRKWHERKTEIVGKPLYATGDSQKPNTLEILLQKAASIQAFTFDIGDTLAVKTKEDPKGDIPSDEVIEALASLVNMGKNVSLVTAKKEDSFKGWVEDKLVPKLDKDKRSLFTVYGDRVTKVYRISEKGELEELSRIEFPASADKDAILAVAKKVASELQKTIAADDSLSKEIRDIIAESPLKAKPGEEYVQLCSSANIQVKGDKTSGKAREIIRSALEKALRDAGLLTDDLMVVLDGKKGAYVKNKEANKPGAIRHLQAELNLAPDQVVYVADQFAGKSTADLSSAKTGVHCLNVGVDEQSAYPNVYNTKAKGPEGSVEFMKAAEQELLYQKCSTPEKAAEGFVNMFTKATKVQSGTNATIEENMQKSPETLKICDKMVSGIIRAFFAMQYFTMNKKKLMTSEKADKSVVTDADYILNRFLKEYFASLDIPFVGEESEHDLSAIQGGTYITVDPIDGTSNFVRMFNGELDRAALDNVTLISYVKDGRPIIGLCFNHYTGELDIAINDGTAKFLSHVSFAEFGGMTCFPGKSKSTVHRMEELDSESALIMGSKASDPVNEELSQKFPTAQIGGLGLRIISLCSSKLKNGLVYHKKQKAGVWDLAASFVFASLSGVTIFDGNGDELDFTKAAYFPGHGAIAVKGNALGFKKPRAAKPESPDMRRPERSEGAKEKTVKILLQKADSIQAFTFDIGETLAVKTKEDLQGDTPSDEIIDVLASLINTGKHVSVISGKAEKSFKRWIEDKLVPKLDKDKYGLFSIYGDRVTRTYKVNERGKLEEVSRIKFPASADKKAIFAVAEKTAKELQASLLANESLSREVRDLLAANPLVAIEGEEFIQLGCKVNIRIKGDKTSDQAREIIVTTLDKNLREAGLLPEDVIVFADGKKGCFVKNKDAVKPGAIHHLQTALGLRAEQIVYIADQFAGKTVADLSVAETGVHCVNVGENEQNEHPNVYNTQAKNLAGTIEFINLVVKRAESPEAEKSSPTNFESLLETAKNASLASNIRIQALRAIEANREFLIAKAEELISLMCLDGNEEIRNKVHFLLRKLGPAIAHLTGLLSQNLFDYHSKIKEKAVPLALRVLSSIGPSALQVVPGIVDHIIFRHNTAAAITAACSIAPERNDEKIVQWLFDRYLKTKPVYDDEGEEDWDYPDTSTHFVALEELQKIKSDFKTRILRSTLADFIKRLQKWVDSRSVDLMARADFMDSFKELGSIDPKVSITFLTEQRDQIATKDKDGSKKEFLRLLDLVIGGMKRASESKKQSATPLIETPSAKSAHISAGENHTLIEIISEYIVQTAKDKGPGAITPVTQEQTQNIWEAVNLFHDSRIEIFIPQSIGMTENMKKAVREIKKREEGDIITCKPYTTESDLKRLLEQKDPGVKRIVITENQFLCHVENAENHPVAKLAKKDPELFKNVRLLNIGLPDNYQSLNDDREKTVHQSRIIMLAILARLFEKDKTPMVETLLRDMLKNHLDLSEKGLNEFLDMLGKTEEGVSDTGEIIHRILYFLHKAVKLTEDLNKEIQLMKTFWIAA